MASRWQQPRSAFSEDSLAAPNLAGAGIEIIR
jgi:hypothetical protein